jgi:subtilisin-like proprotein convertase family protein
LLAASFLGCEGPAPEGNEVEQTDQDLTVGSRLSIDPGQPVSDSALIDLSPAADWVHWGRSGIGADRKAGVPVKIGPYTKLKSTGLVAQYQPAVGPQYKWTGGTPQASAQTRTGIATPAVGQGMKFDVAVPASAHTLTLYVTVLEAYASVFITSPSLATTVWAGNQRTTWAIPIQMFSPQPRTITVGVRLDSVSASSGLVSLHAVALTAAPDSTLTWLSNTWEATVPANVPQPPPYQANGGFNGPLPVLGTSVRVLGNFDSSAGIYGYELWRGNTKLSEAVGAHPSFVQANPDFVSFHEVAIDNWGKRASGGVAGSYFWAWAAWDVPMNIPDLTCVDFPLDVTSPPGSKPSGPMDLSFTIEHTYLSDLEISLVNPLGASAVLASRLGGASAAGYVNTRIVSHGATSAQLAQSSPPYTFVYNPAQSMYPLVGGPINGRWLLHVCDQAGVDVGKIWWARLYVVGE